MPTSPKLLISALAPALALCLLATPLALLAAEPAKPAAKPAPKPVPAAKAAPGLAAANEEQIQAAGMVHYGAYQCEFTQTVSVALNAKTPGYVDVSLKKDTWTMKPVLSSTGALRLEDVKGRMLMLQIANKSMLMDVQVGRRLVDDCVHEKQQASHAAAAAKAASQAQQ